MMPPDRLRARSLTAFKAMLASGLLGVVMLIGLPSPGYAGASDTVAQVFAAVAVVLLVVALIASLVSLADGIMAWQGGARPCPWIVVCGLLLVVPAALFMLEI
jgi:uncharacterized membrane protein YtjA (UPF0391 family)